MFSCKVSWAKSRTMMWSFRLCRNLLKRRHLATKKLCDLRWRHLWCSDYGSIIITSRCLIYKILLRLLLHDILSRALVKCVLSLTLLRFEKRLEIGLFSNVVKITCWLGLRLVKGLLRKLKQRYLSCCLWKFNRGVKFLRVLINVSVLKLIYLWLILSNGSIFWW